MSQIQHTEQCLKMQAAIEEWQAKYPDACPVCCGTGLTYQSGDWVPYGSTSAQLPGSDEPCGGLQPKRAMGQPVTVMIGCEEANKCPRCGNDRVWHDEGNPSDPVDGYHEDCPQCGFKCMACNMPGSHEQDHCPQWECYCWEEAAQKEEEILSRLDEMQREQQNKCPHGMDWAECLNCNESYDI